MASTSQTTSHNEINDSDEEQQMHTERDGEEDAAEGAFPTEEEDIEKIKEKHRKFYDETKFIHGSCILYWDKQEMKKKCGAMPNKEQRSTTQEGSPDHTGCYIYIYYT